MAKKSLVYAPFKSLHRAQPPLVKRNPNDLTLRNSRAVRKRLAQLDAKLVQLRKDVDSLFQRGKKR